MRGRTHATGRISIMKLEPRRCSREGNERRNVSGNSVSADSSISRNKRETRIRVLLATRRNPHGNSDLCACSILQVLQARVRSEICLPYYGTQPSITEATLRDSLYREREIERGEKENERVSEHEIVNY